MNAMSVEELISRLKAHEEHLRVPDDVDDEHVLLTRAQWRAKEEKNGGKGSSSGAKKGGTRDHGKCRGCGRGRGRGRGRWHGDSERTRNDEFDIKKVQCYNC